jgi:glutathione S-transferase
MVSVTSQKIYGTDLVAEYIPNVKTYMQLLETRPHVQKVAVDRTAAMAKFLK